MIDDKSKNPVFIVSTGRAGSTMIARLLAMHPDVCALHEPHPHLRTEAFVKWSAPERKFSLSLEGVDKQSLTALHDFIGIRVYPELLEEMLEVVYQRPNRTKTYTFPPHTEWSGWEKQRFEEIAGNMMRTLGYVV